MLRSSWRPAAGVLLAVLIAFGLSGPRRLAERAFDALRTRPVQTVNLDLGKFVGPSADASLQGLIRRLIADKVVVTSREGDRSPSSEEAAGALAGFMVRLPDAETRAPRLTVTGARRVLITLDRAKLQAILEAAGRSDLAIPARTDGEIVEVNVARAVEARYGHCPAEPSPFAQPAANTDAGDGDCLVLSEGPPPAIAFPVDMDLRQLVAIGLNAAGLTASETEQFLATADWLSALTLPVPLAVRSYQIVGVGGARGTLFALTDRHGPAYALLWKDAGLLFTLSGFGDSANAVRLAQSVH